MMKKGGSRLAGLAIVAMGLLFLCLSGCGGNAYEKANFKDNGQSINTRFFQASPNRCYLAAKKVALGNNFTIEKEDPRTKTFTATRYFADGKDSTVLSLNISVIGTGTPSIYCNAVQYVNKVTGGATVRQSEVSVNDWRFYNKFFAAVAEVINPKPIKKPAQAKKTAARK